ncbi:Lipoprotein signal peptidase [Fischerella thermalis JSC-11]|jgi:signal peptidase II|uniref:Lipoprotein signal peptidase n=6 Tax=Fischerella TaxID=1190 RepID=G6FUR8_9CYAN|nr:Lipoprotein signal peptidase [Fischerella thermalis JSC-11]BAU07262.1 lipoprotein signal peptidase [Fischerella sp. NIES-3754]BCX09588.1 MAG: lipoprotein signal peptidase [Fischerella sp.]
MTNNYFAMRLKNKFFWIIAFVAFFLDQITKFWVVQTFSLQQTLPLLPGIFHLTYVTNTGAAFSLLSGKVEWLRWLSLGVSLALIALAWFGPLLNRWEQLGYGLILGGAMGNGIDRFALGYVVDFLDFRLINFPVFNLADVFINIGIVCLLIATFQKTPSSGRRY